MRCDQCGRSTAVANELRGGDEWVCDACALDLWAFAPESLTGAVAIVRETLRTDQQEVFAGRGRRVKAEQLVAGVCARKLTAEAHAWTRPQWLELAEEVGVKRPSPDTVAAALALLDGPRQEAML